MTKLEALTLRRIVEQAVGGLDDRTASCAPMLHRTLRLDGGLVAAGSRIVWKGRLYRAAADLWDRAEYTPEASPALWETVDYRGGIRVIPTVISAAAAFQKGEQGWWGDRRYVSLLDGNVWTPEAYPAGWEEV